jgi:hypothetical protein
MRGRSGFALLALAAALACASPPAIDLEESDVAPGSFDADVIEGGIGGERALRRLALDFYQRIANRRFDSIATYQDPALHEFFRTPEAFADYYADLAQVLADHHFEANRPTRIRLEEFSSETPERVRVRVRLTGENGLPLRWWETSVVREDRWERMDGRWWIIPGKL